MWLPQPAASYQHCSRFLIHRREGLWPACLHALQNVSVLQPTWRMKACQQCSARLHGWFVTHIPLLSGASGAHSLECIHFLKYDLRGCISASCLWHCNSARQRLIPLHHHGIVCSDPCSAYRDQHATAAYIIAACILAAIGTALDSTAQHPGCHTRMHRGGSNRHVIVITGCHNCITVSVHNRIVFSLVVWLGQ